MKLKLIGIGLITGNKLVIKKYTIKLSKRLKNIYKS